MSLSYEPLWQMLKNINVSKMEFAKMIGMSNATLAKLSKNEPITLTTVDKICNQFNCPIENVVKHIQDVQPNESVFVIGSIVLATEPVGETTKTLMFRKRSFVIIGVIPATEKTIYKVAPIFKRASITHTKQPNMIYFENVDIDNRPTSGYFSSKNILELPSGNIEKRIGLMPSKYIQQI